jgi:hypothetical protein
MTLDGMTFLVTDDGEVQFVHSDDAVEVAEVLGGANTITRASCVEPTPDGRWTADMAPSGGPVLGPFTTRTAALAEEREWLRVHKGL